MPRLRRFMLWLCLPAILAACGAAEPKWAPDADVARAHYVHSGPPTITLFTVINNNTGGGAHSALMVNASERVIFDPAGTFYHPHLPERNDVHFGMSPPAVDFYIDYHARVTYHVVEQTIAVSPAVAALALQQVQAYGAVPKAQCSNSVTTILARLPGFENMIQTPFPKRSMEAFAHYPGVITQKHYDNSPDDNSGTITAPPLLRRQ